MVGEDSEEDWGGLEAAAEVEQPACEEAAGPLGEGDAPAEMAPKRRSRKEQAAYARECRLEKRRRAGGGSALTRVTSASSSGLGSAPGIGSGDELGGSLLARSMTRCTSTSYKSFLKPAMAHADECGVTPSRYQEYLWSYGEALMQSLVSKGQKLVRHCISSASASDPAEAQFKCSLFVRQRKYDETNSVLSCLWDQGQLEPGEIERVLDAEVGPTKVFVTETKSAMSMERRGGGGGHDSMLVSWTSPAPLQAVSHNTAECYYKALHNACTQSYDSEVDAQFERQVDVSCHDQHSSNGKAERLLTRDHPQRAKLECLCDAHKKASVATRVFELWPALPNQSHCFGSER